MKTKIIFIVLLFIGGFFITSCQKDNVLLPEEEVNITNEVDKNEPHDVVPHWEVDPISNYPDPFRDVTTIEFKLERSARVSLIVYNPNFEGITYLMNGYQRAGVYQCEFDATGLPDGTYIARLKIDDVVIKERMTKAHPQKQEDFITP